MWGLILFLLLTVLVYIGAQRPIITQLILFLVGTDTVYSFWLSFIRITTYLSLRITDSKVSNDWSACSFPARSTKVCITIRNWLPIHYQIGKQWIEHLNCFCYYIPRKLQERLHCPHGVSFQLSATAPWSIRFCKESQVEKNTVKWEA